jgi:CRP-like cAMP-binding protein
MSDHPEAGALRAARHLVARSLAPGEVLFRQGEPGDSVYVLVSGEVEVRVAGENGDHHLADIGPGTFLGEFALLADALRTRSVVGRTEAELWELPRERFEAALSGHEAWASRFLMAVARELARQMLAVDRQLVGLMEESRHQEVPAGRVRELEKLRRQLSGEWSF